MKYEIKESLGKGAMGEVFLAFDSQLNREVALKKLTFNNINDLTQSQIEELKLRFIQEAQAAAKLSHPNIITIFEVATDGENDFIIMERLKGKPLDEFISMKSRFTFDEIVAIGIQICKGLDYAHKNGVVHRDIKPENIFLEDDLLVKITDFGIARMEEGALVKTQFGAFMGTPVYASPEQWNGLKKLDHRTDLYSTGVILYQLITSRLPFEADSYPELAYKIGNSDPIPPHMILPGIPPTLELVVMKALSKSPEDRYESGNEMANALRQVMGEIHSQTASATPRAVSDGHNTITYYSSKNGSLAGYTPVKDSIALYPDLNFTNLNWVFTLFDEWEEKHIGDSLTESILDKLLEIPIYTEPFSGGLLIDHSLMLLIWNGLILQAVNGETQVMGEAAIDSLPKRGKHFSIYSDPLKEQTNLPLLAASILSRRQIIHKNLDSRIVDISALIKKLEGEEFTGVIEMDFHPGKFYINLFEGKKVSLLQSRTCDFSLDDVFPNDLTSFIGAKAFLVNVFETKLNPLRESIKRVFKEVWFSVDYDESEDFNPAKLLKRNGGDFHPGAQEKLKNSYSLQLVMKEFNKIRIGKNTVNPVDLLENDFAVKFFNWVMSDLFFHVLTSGNRDTLKYVTTWIPLIHKVRINHKLEGTNGEMVKFDLVTEDKDGKVLHLVKRSRSAGKEALLNFIEEVKSVKTYLIKSGDIGGAFFVTPQKYDEEALSHYYELTTVKKKLFDKITKYKGFVRLGKNRGFHLCLVREKEDVFSLIAPVL